MDERARAEVALLFYCCMVSLVTVGSSPIAVCLLLLAMADRRKRTFRWDHRLQIGNTKTHEKNARKSARAEGLHYCCIAVWCPWLPLFHRLPLSAYCCHTTAPSLQPLLHPHGRVEVSCVLLYYCCCTSVWCSLSHVYTRRNKSHKICHNVLKDDTHALDD